MNAPDIADRTDSAAPEWAPDTQRVTIAVSASAEVDSIARLLRLPGFELDPDLLRGLSIRLTDLSSVILSALTDEVEPAERIAQRLNEGAA